uniref:Small ribosomal subunit protein bS16c n=1 Tax=Haplopteris elongata TaxID=451070 RepID=A0A3G5CTB9_9MONI|nr:ribosomal protein S16 [Haplopteris elongata]AYW16141.1 ribosomal protein S16 [Haplopteris elongata]
MVKLRFKLCGRKQRIIYRIVAIDVRVKREGKILREVGFYNPHKKEIQLDLFTRNVLYENGTQSTKSVKYILKRSKQKMI